MLRRLVLGLFEGVVIGTAVALGLDRGLGIATLGPWLGYLAAAFTGVLVGLVAGKPLWRRDAKVEALLKAGAGALLASALLYALRRWAQVPVDLSAVGGGSGALPDLPLATLPLLATTLAVLFELDDAPSRGEMAKIQATRAAAQHRIEDSEALREIEALEEELTASERKARR